MKKILFISLVLFLVSCKTTSVNAWQDQMILCDAYTIKKIEFGKDDIYPGISSDTISVMYITMARTPAKYKIDGPDYCLLSVIDEKNDTIGRVSINGLPLPGRSRTYPAFGKTVWKTKPDIAKIHISLPPYCDDIRMKSK